MKNLIFIGLFVIAITGILFSADPALMSSHFPMDIFANNHNTAASIQDNDEQLIKKEFNVSPGNQLDIDLETGGTISVKGWDKNVVSVKASLSGKNWKDIQMEITENSGNVRIHSEAYKHRKHWNANADLEIFVPKKYDVQLETMGGDVTLNNIEGEMSGQTMGGRLDLSNLKGDLNLKTMGGSIDLRNSDVDGEVNTMGGNVNIQDVSGSVKGSSMGGNVVYNNVKRKGETSTSKAIKITTMGGAIDLNEAPAGADVHTMGGNITINSASKFVKAKTMGGDIEIKEVDGDVDATTMGGDLHIKILGNDKTSGRDIHLVSMSGDVVLLVPKNFSMDIKAEVPNDSFDIISDFQIEKKILKNHDDDDDDEEYIRGTGKILGGNNMVTLEAKNGNIRIESY